MTVLLIVLALLLVLLYFAGKYFFNFTFSRQDKPYDWESGLKPDDPITMIRDRGFWDSPEREEVTATRAARRSSRASQVPCARRASTRC